MNKFKKKISLYVVAALLAVTAVSCRYEEGPFLSFRNPEDRLVGYWKLNHVFLNGTEIDSTDVLPCKPGNYYAFFTERMVSVSALEGNTWYESVYGVWDFQNNYKDLYVQFSLRNKKYSYLASIKKLTRDKLFYEFTDANDDIWRFEFDSRSSMYY